MKFKLATICLVLGTFMAPMTSSATDVYSGTSKPERHADRAHPLTWVKDSVITTKIKAKLATDHPGSMKHIQVDTDADGVVWLTGTANNQSEIDAAIATARSTENVKSVWSDLTVENDR
jgi:hyperosmotically inducible periplasmic protein